MCGENSSVRVEFTPNSVSAFKPLDLQQLIILEHRAKSRGGLDWRDPSPTKKPKGAPPDLATGGKGVGKIAPTPPHRFLLLGERGNSSAYHLRRQGATEALCYHGYYARSWGSEEGSKCV